MDDARLVRPSLADGIGFGHHEYRGEAAVPGHVEAEEGQAGLGRHRKLQLVVYLGAAHRVESLRGEKLAGQFAEAGFVGRVHAFEDAVLA